MTVLLLRLLIVAVVCWGLLVLLGVLPSPFSRTTIRIRNGGIRISGADLPARARDHVADVIREAGLRSGFIVLSRHRQVVFSLGFPEALRQRLRNILLN
jgi:hypothetical protein